MIAAAVAAEPRDGHRRSRTRRPNTAHVDGFYSGPPARGTTARFLSRIPRSAPIVRRGGRPRNPSASARCASRDRRPDARLALGYVTDQPGRDAARTTLRFQISRFVSDVDCRLRSAVRFAIRIQPSAFLRSSCMNTRIAASAAVLALTIGSATSRPRSPRNRKPPSPPRPEDRRRVHAADQAEPAGSAHHDRAGRSPAGVRHRALAAEVPRPRRRHAG